MNHYLIENGYIPLDKSWIIRMGLLDLLNSHKNIIEFLEKQKNLSDDLKALYRALIDWNSDEPIDVGESGTLYRFLKFASWKLGLKKEFILSGTLKNRNICDNPEIINWPQEKLITLDGGTSQWASAAALAGDDEEIDNPPYKLKITYEAIKHWKTSNWEIRFDKTILAQASAYLQWLKTGKMDFKPEQAEDYCFARAFDLISAEEGEKLWPSLHGHESDRIKEMEEQLQKEKITSKDHRVVHAIAMLRKSKENVQNPECVNKSWPQFWMFLQDSVELANKAKHQ
ncbi:hypothetical protein ACFLZ7_01445 [Nanoarchaeota archaeon]